MSRVDVLQPQENPHSRWVNGRNMPESDYWFGNRYGGKYADSLTYNAGLIELVCRENYLPPLILSNSNVPNAPDRKAVTLKTFSDQIPSPFSDNKEELLDADFGWQIEINQGVLLERSAGKGVNGYASEMDRNLKRALLNVTLMEALDMRLEEKKRYMRTLSKGLKQLGGLLAASIAFVPVEDPVVRFATAEFGFALVQNYLAIGEDVDLVALLDEDHRYELDYTSKVLSQLWRENKFPARYETEGFGPHVGKNILSRSIPMTFILEPFYRYAGNVRELREPWVKPIGS